MTRLLPFSLLLLTLLLAGLGAPSLPAQDDDAAKLEALEEFKRYFRRFRETSQMVEAVHTLEGNETPQAAKTLLDLLDHREEDVRNAAMAVLESYEEQRTFQALLDELPEVTDPMRASRLIEVLGRARVAAALPVFATLLEEGRGPDASTRRQIAIAVGRIGDASQIELLRTLLADGDELVRIAAADAARVLGAKELGKDLVPLIREKAWQVRAAGIAAAAKLRPAEAIEPLIDVLRDEGRLQEEAADALFEITTFDVGTDAKQWAEQWQKLQSYGWRIPTDEELAKARASRRRADALYGKTGESTQTFAGIPTTSRRVLFIIDVSGSMEDHVVQKEKFDAGYPDFQKLTIVKQELINTIDSLDGNTHFNIVSFASKLDTWKNRLVPANIVNRASAKRYTERLEPIGGSEAQELAAVGLGGTAALEAGRTNTFGALMYPFGIDPEKPRRAPTTESKTVLRNELDTVYFLSDGRPSTGKLVDTREILAEVRRLNEAYRIVFHTIAIGEFQKDFLEGLAVQNGGVFVDLGR